MQSSQKAALEEITTKRKPPQSIDSGRRLRTRCLLSTPNAS